MILVLAPDAGAPLADLVERSGERRGVEVLRWTPSAMIREVGLALEIDGPATRVRFAYGGRAIAGEAIAGVITAVDGFAPALWPAYSPRDQLYAAQEAVAAWVAALAALPGRLLNPPSADALGGAIVTPVEVSLQAGEVGLGAPAIAYVESAAALRDERADEVRACACALGEVTPVEAPLGRAWLAAAGEGPIRVRGAGRGRVRVVMVGARALTAEGEAPPATVVAALGELQRRLGRTLGEVWLSREDDGGWLVEEALRWPGATAVAALGAALGDAILDALMESRGEEASRW